MANLAQVLGSTFNPMEVDPSTGGGGSLPVSGPEGLLVIITESDLKQNKQKTGGFIEFTLQCIEDDKQGMTGKERLNIVNTNKQAEAIAKAQLSAICHVTGQLGELVDTAILHNIPFRVLTRIQQFKNDPEKQKEAETKGWTEIYGYLDADGNKPGQQGQPQQPQQPTTPAESTPPQNQQQAPQGTQGGGWGQQPPAQQQAPAQGGWGAQSQPQTQSAPPQGAQGGWGQGNGGAPAWGQAQG